MRSLSGNYSWKCAASTRIEKNEIIPESPSIPVLISLIFTDWFARRVYNQSQIRLHTEMKYTDEPILPAAGPKNMRPGKQVAPSFGPPTTWNSGQSPMIIFSSVYTFWGWSSQSASLLDISSDNSITVDFLFTSFSSSSFLYSSGRGCPARARAALFFWLKLMSFFVAPRCSFLYFLCLPFNHLFYFSPLHFLYSFPSNRFQRISHFFLLSI